MLGQLLFRWGGEQKVWLLFYQFPWNFLSHTILSPLLLRKPFPEHIFTVYSVKENHVMCCFVIVQLNSWRERTLLSFPLHFEEQGMTLLTLYLSLFLLCCPFSHSLYLPKHKFSYISSSPLWFLPQLPQLRSHWNDQTTVCDIITNNNWIERVSCLPQCLPFLFVFIRLLFLHPL